MQTSDGTWNLVLHRVLKLDPQAASFKQRSARLCNQQNPVRSQNVQEQGKQAEAAIQTLLTAAGVRQLPPSGAATHSMAVRPQQSVPTTPQSQTRQVSSPVQHLGP